MEPPLRDEQHHHIAPVRSSAQASVCAGSLARALCFVRDRGARRELSRGGALVEARGSGEIDLEVAVGQFSDSGVNLHGEFNSAARVSRGDMRGVRRVELVELVEQFCGAGDERSVRLFAGQFGGARLRRNRSDQQDDDEWSRH